MISIPWTWRRSETAADYASAVIPLDEAHQHSHSFRLRPRTDPEGQLDDEASEDDDGADKDGDDGDTTMLVNTSAAAEYSIEGLRREVRRGRRGGNWTAYESECFGSACLLRCSLGGGMKSETDRAVTVKSKLINKAIQDIGMGRYNWQLFVLCGFGWFADK
jgi:hypothetical protein